MKTAIVLFSLLLTGCSTLDTVIQTGAEANDTAVQAAEFTLCQGASIGAIRRAYGDRPAIWRELCSDNFSFRE